MKNLTKTHLRPYFIHFLETKYPEIKNPARWATAAFYIYNNAEKLNLEPATLIQQENGREVYEEILVNFFTQKGRKNPSKSARNYGRSFQLLQESLVGVDLESMNAFVKWVGGKRQLLPTLRELAPKEFNTYIEPFIGGGAFLFDLHPQKAIINDINKNLISTYNFIKSNPYLIMDKLDEYENAHKNASNKQDFYLEMRQKYNENVANERYTIAASAQFMYLNKACFNGLYRVNSKGLFNVPFNKKEVVTTYNEENIKSVSAFLKDVKILNVDFAEACVDAQKGDFVFFDSPYDLIKDDTFAAYDKSGFLKEDHIRLANLFKELDARGCYCMLTNHNTKLINELYEGYNIRSVKVKRLINSDATKRYGEEVIITNYGTL